MTTSVLHKNISQAQWSNAIQNAKENPKLLRVRAKNGDLPIHMAVKMHCTDDVVLNFLERDPKLADTKDKDGKTLLDLAKSSGSSRRILKAIKTLSNPNLGKKPRRSSSFLDASQSISNLFKNNRFSLRK